MNKNFTTIAFESYLEVEKLEKLLDSAKIKYVKIETFDSDYISYLHATCNSLLETIKNMVDKTFKKST